MVQPRASTPPTPMRMAPSRCLQGFAHDVQDQTAERSNKGQALGAVAPKRVTKHAGDELSFGHRTPHYA
jgi:hypothetical protein